MEIKRLENSSVELTLELKAEAIEESYGKKLNDYKKKIVMKGFRQGKAPLSLIESKYGREIREEATFELMEENLKNSYKDIDEKDRPLPSSTPKLQNEEALLPFKPDTDITYSVVYDVMPVFDLPQYTGLDLEAELHKTTEEDVDREIENIRQKNALIIRKDGAVENSDIVTIDYAELDDSGNEIKDKSRKDFTFTVGSSYNFYKLDSDILGMTAGETKVIEKTYGEDSGMPAEYTGKTVKIRVSVTEIKRKEVPELDDDFAQDVKDSYKTMEDMRNDIRKNIQETTDNINKRIKLDAVLSELADKTQISLPESMVETQLDYEWRQYAMRIGFSEDQLEKFLVENGSSKQQFLTDSRPNTELELKKQLITEKISGSVNSEVTDDEVKEEMKQFGDITEDNPNYSYFSSLVKDEIKTRKTQEWLIENNNFREPAKTKETKETKETEETKGN